MLLLDMSVPIEKNARPESAKKCTARSPSVKRYRIIIHSLLDEKDENNEMLTSDIVIMKITLRRIGNQQEGHDSLFYNHSNTR